MCLKDMHSRGELWLSVGLAFPYFSRNRFLMKQRRNKREVSNHVSFFVYLFFRICPSGSYARQDGRSKGIFFYFFYKVNVKDVYR